jgi:hypothetical protein
LFWRDWGCNAGGEGQRGVQGRDSGARAHSRCQGPFPVPIRADSRCQGPIPVLGEQSRCQGTIPGARDMSGAEGGFSVPREDSRCHGHFRCRGRIPGAKPNSRCHSRCQGRVSGAGKSAAREGEKSRCQVNKPGGRGRFPVPGCIPGDRPTYRLWLFWLLFCYSGYSGVHARVQPRCAVSSHIFSLFTWFHPSSPRSRGSEMSVRGFPGVTRGRG